MYFPSSPFPLLQMDNQAEDRAHRIGQKKEVRVFVLACGGSIGEDILRRAAMKRGIDEKVRPASLSGCVCGGAFRVPRGPTQASCTSV